MTIENTEVVVTEAKDGEPAQAVIQDKVAGRAWSGEGKTSSEATTEAFHKFVSDRRAREYTPR